MKSAACASVSERQLELYLMNRLPAQMAGSIYDDSIAQIEDHLLICPTCQGAAETHILLMTALRSEQTQKRNFAMVANAGQH